MADEETEEAEAPKKKSKMPLILGLVLALAGGGGGFYATWSGMILGAESGDTAHEETHVPQGPDVAFVAMDPLVVSLSPTSTANHLVFRAQLEVPTAFEQEVQTLLPRVTDVLNSYLRALDPGDLEDHSALGRLRAQMLRRVQIVVGQGRVSDLLVMEFVLN